MIVEEAAEVLEAHIISSLTKHCKHLILIGKIILLINHITHMIGILEVIKFNSISYFIVFRHKGDHKQLRPSNAVYKLAKEFHFDISLFERMVNSDVPYYALGEQHRMRPEVSSLITPSIYPNLLDHVSVLNRPHIRGVNKDIFFLNHTNFETEVFFIFTVLHTSLSILCD